MPTTTTQAGYAVSITSLNANWDPAVQLPAALQGQKIGSIQFNPSAASDVMQIRSGSATGPIIFYANCTGVTDQRIKYFDFTSIGNPFIVFSECTLSNAANASILIDFMDH
jgi:hypothetical protein